MSLFLKYRGYIVLTAVNSTVSSIEKSSKNPKIVKKVRDMKMDDQ
jgi:hypothetical protein